MFLITQPDRAVGFGASSVSPLLFVCGLEENEWTGHRKGSDCLWASSTFAGPASGPALAPLVLFLCGLHLLIYFSIMGSLFLALPGKTVLRPSAWM